MYYKTWYALTSRSLVFDKNIRREVLVNNDFEHAKEESRGKIKPIDVTGYIADGECYYPVNISHFVQKNKMIRKFVREKKISLQLVNNLRQLFQTASVKPNSVKKIECSCEVKDDTLIVAIAPDVTPTLNAVFSHQNLNQIKHVVLVSTSDTEMKGVSTKTQEKLNQIGLDTEIVFSDVNGTDLQEKLIFKEELHNVHTNITPGSKGQTAVLSFIANSTFPPYDKS